MDRAFVLFLLLLLLLAPAFAGTLPAGLAATINGTVNFTFASDFEADTFSARNHGIAINDSYLDVNTTYFLTLNITNFTTDIYNFTANSTTTATNPTNFTAKMRNSNTRYNLKVNGVYSQEVLTDSSGNATWQYNSWTGTQLRFLLTTCLESWSYTQWSECSSGTQSRTGADANACGTAYNISEVVMSCYMGTSGGGGGGGSGGSFSQGTPSKKLLTFSFQTPAVLKISATVFYGLPESQNVTISYPASISPLIPPIPGLAYSFLEIVPTFNSSQYLTQAQIDFEVNKSWYSKNGIVPSSTALLRYDGRYWHSLSTIRRGEAASAYSFAANTTSFSLFAITGTKRPALQPTPTSAAAAPAIPATSILPTTTTGTPTTSTPAVQPPPVPRPPPSWALPVLLGSILVVLLAMHFRQQSKPAEPQVKLGAQVAIKGIVTSHAEDGFECTDGTEFIFVKSDRKPPISSWVDVKGTLSRSGGRSYIAATSVRQLD